MNVALSLLAVVFTLFAPLGLVLSGTPMIGRPVLVIAPPLSDLGAIVLQAGGQEISPMRAPLATLAQSDDPDFIARLYRQGAWAVRDGSLLDIFCGAFS